MNKNQTVYIVDDDEGLRDGLAMLLDTVEQPYKLYRSALDFLKNYESQNGGCLILDMRMPRMTGLDLQVKLNQMQCSLPIIFISGHGDILMAVKAMRQGALDFITKPFREQELLDRINDALTFDFDFRQSMINQQQKINKIDTLTDRECEVFTRVTAGDMNKVIALDLGVSERTVEMHRSQVMKKLGARTLAQLVRIKIETDLLPGIH